MALQITIDVFYIESATKYFKYQEQQIARKTYDIAYKNETEMYAAADCTQRSRWHYEQKKMLECIWLNSVFSYSLWIAYMQKKIILNERFWRNCKISKI